MEKIREQFAIYSRKSKFTGKGESIGNQIELCRQYISAHFGSDFAQQAYVYEDEGFSGGNLDRPQFKKMMQEAKKKNSLPSSAIAWTESAVTLEILLI